MAAKKSNGMLISLAVCLCRVVISNAATCYHST